MKMPIMNSLKDFISGEANKRFIHDGDLDSGFGWAGQVAGLIEDIPSVEELFESNGEGSRDNTKSLEFLINRKRSDS